MNFVSVATIAVIGAASVIGGSFLLSKFQLNLKKEELNRGYIVKGYATKNAMSDIGFCHLSLSVKGSNLGDCYQKLQLSRTDLLDLIKKADFMDSEVELMSIIPYAVYKKDVKGNPTNEVDFYNMTQSYKITSNRVKSIANLPNELSALYKQGIDITVSTPQFYITNIDKVKDEALAAATQNAYERAQTLAENSGGQVGALRRAAQGVFQVTEPLSTNISSYGEYNTDTIEKSVKAVVSVEYQLAE